MAQATSINALVPELAVTDWRASLDFYCRLLGFSVAYDRPEEGFAFLAIGSAQLMIDQIGVGRDVDNAPREHPFGRGFNLQVEVPALDPILDRLHEAGVTLFLEPEERWHRSGQRELGQRQFIVADPDGYLLRLCEGPQQPQATIPEACHGRMASTNGAWPGPMPPWGHLDRRGGSSA